MQFCFPFILSWQLLAILNGRTISSDMRKIHRIAIVGPESTGKSLLSEQLAYQYQTVWVPEIARDYLHKLNRPYTFDDLSVIAKLQLEKEKSMSESAKHFLFCDTNLVVIKVWSDFKYGRTEKWIVEAIHKSDYSIHLLTDIDIPWEDDPLREHPHFRKELFERYLQELNTFGLDYQIVNGIGESRLKNALNHLEKLEPDLK